MITEYLIKKALHTLTPYPKDAGDFYGGGHPDQFDRNSDFLEWNNRINHNYTSPSKAPGIVHNRFPGTERTSLGRVRSNKECALWLNFLNTGNALEGLTRSNQYNYGDMMSVLALQLQKARYINNRYSEKDRLNGK